MVDMPHTLTNIYVYVYMSFSSVSTSICTCAINWVCLGIKMLLANAGISISLDISGIGKYRVLLSVKTSLVLSRVHNIKGR